VERFAKHDTDVSALRQRLGLPTDKFILLTTGRNHPKKGYALIPVVAEQLARTRQDFLWLVVGKGTEPIDAAAAERGVGSFVRAIPSLGTMAASNGNQDRYRLPSDKLIEMYQAADIFVFPSLIESFGVVLVEAMAAGLPIVTTDAPGCRDLVHSGETGLVSPTNDAPQMARHILNLLDDPQLRTRLKTHASEASRQYDWPNVARRYVSTYRELLQGMDAPTQDRQSS
jgi:glycosyltransferase involved in cell wall biosynthesis